MSGEWRDRALCRGADPELFFPISGHGSPSYVKQVAEAKSVCELCPVREECLSWALDFSIKGDCGVYGGLDEYERAALRKIMATEEVTV